MTHAQLMQKDLDTVPSHNRAQKPNHFSMNQNLLTSVFGLNLPLLICQNMAYASVTKVEKSKTLLSSRNHHYKKSLARHINFLVYFYRTFTTDTI